MEKYEASRLANFGRDTSKAYGQFLRAQEKLCDEINLALANGISTTKIAHDMMGRCPSHEMAVDLLSVVHASVRMKKIPESVLEPFNEGIRPKRI